MTKSVTAVLVMAYNIKTATTYTYLLWLRFIRKCQLLQFICFGLEVIAMNTTRTNTGYLNFHVMLFSYMYEIKTF